MASAHVDVPALEQVASYIDGVMDPEARARFVGHAARCARCSELLVETMALLSVDAQREPAAGRLDRFWRGSVD